jgi:hypothetical protein
MLMFWIGLGTPGMNVRVRAAVTNVLDRVRHVEDERQGLEDPMNAFLTYDTISHTARINS